MGSKVISTTFRLLSEDQGDTRWMSRGECRRTHRDTGARVYEEDLWFPVGTTGPGAVQAAHAKAICSTSCPVLEECREWAVNCLEYGVAGGLDEEERRTVRRARARARRTQTGVAS